MSPMKNEIRDKGDGFVDQDKYAAKKKALATPARFERPDSDRWRERRGGGRGVGVGV